MAGILKDLCQDSRFTGIWSSVLHPFQRPIPGVSKDHLGLVQEPIYGFNGNSHSGRMLQLGETVINLLPKYGDKFGTHIFIQSCQIVGVMPSEPWRILEDNLPTNNKEIYQKFGIKTGS